MVATAPIVGLAERTGNGGAPLKIYLTIRNLLSKPLSLFGTVLASNGYEVDVMQVREWPRRKRQGRKVRTQL